MTRLLWETRIRSLRFFPTLLYGLTRAVNQSPAFCMGRDEHGQFGRYDTVSPSYTVFHPETERFTDLWTTYHPDFSVFYRRYLDDMARYGTPGLPKPGTPTNLFCVSALPWLHFRAFNLNLEKGYDFFPPIFTIGRYQYCNGHATLPLSIQVHHGVCDGYHVARLVTILQQWLDVAALD